MSFESLKCFEPKNLIWDYLYFRIKTTHGQNFIQKKNLENEMNFGDFIFAVKWEKINKHWRIFIFDFQCVLL